MVGLHSLKQIRQVIDFPRSALSHFLIVPPNLPLKFLGGAHRYSLTVAGRVVLDDR
jgi:hypothetical protein